LITASRIACAMAATFLATSAYPAATALVEQPRPFGYVVGDVMTQRVLLEIDGRELVPAGVPKAQRVNLWLERRPARIESLPDGRRWLAIDYQVINAPQSLTTVNLPAFDLQGAADGATLKIAAWPISVNALTSDGSSELRPDRPAPAIATAPIRRQIAIWSSAFLLVLAAWLGWLAWRNWRAAAAQPFAHALHEMRHLDGTAPEAWRALHHAFDRTAGRVVHTATLAALFERVPQLQSLRPEIEQFFAQSTALFFGGGLPADRMSARALCAQLRRIERRIER
jgi:mxaA protein